jgi:hypothetical protein
VFIGHSDAGSVALLALGGLFGLLSLTGQPLARAKFGENELVFERAITEEVVRRIEEGPSSEVRELTEVVHKAQERITAPAEPSLAAHAERLLNYKSEVFHALERILPPESWLSYKAVDRAQPPDFEADSEEYGRDRIGDGIITLADTRIFVEVKYRADPSPRIPYSNVRALLKQVRVFNKATGESAGILVVGNTPLPEEDAFEFGIEGNRYAEWVQW